MGYRYYARVTFPAAAAAIPSVHEWLERPNGRRVSISEIDGGNCIAVSAEDCGGGEIEVTSVLDAAQVPYDHYHSDDCAGSPHPWTEHVRFSPAGERTLTKVETEAEGDAQIARELLAMLEAGNLHGMRTRLQELSAKALPPDESMDAIASSWTSAAQPQRPSARGQGCAQ